MEAKVHRWSDLPLETPIANLDRRRILGEKVMLADVVLHPGCEVQTHQHENEQFAFVMSGKAVFSIGEGAGRYEVTVGAGEVLHLPSNVPHGVVPLEETHILDILSPPGAMGVDSQEEGHLSTASSEKGSKNVAPGRSGDPGSSRASYHPRG